MLLLGWLLQGVPVSRTAEVLACQERGVDGIFAACYWCIFAACYWCMHVE